MDHDRLVAACARLPVFPLSRVVLLPGALLPLHVFEPRYRALITACIEGDRLLGIATLVPGHEAEYYGAPPFYPEIGIGRIVQHQPFPDGRCNVVLQAVGAMRVRSELASDEPFRLVAGELFPPRAPAPDAVDRLRLLLLQLGVAHPNARDEIARLSALSEVELVDALARKLIDEPDDRRRYLGLRRLAEQVAEVESRLVDLLLTGEAEAEA